MTADCQRLFGLLVIIKTYNSPSSLLLEKDRINYTNIIIIEKKKNPHYDYYHDLKELQPMQNEVPKHPKVKEAVGIIT